MKNLKFMAITAALLMLSACASHRTERTVQNFARFYQPIMNLEEARNILENPVQYNDCTAVSVADMEYSAKKMAESGYLLVGETLFARDQYPIIAAKLHCGDTGAERVLFNTQIVSSTTNSMTIMSPQISYAKTTYQGHLGNYIGASTTTFTQYVPQNINWHVNTYRNWATYWVKGKPPILGAYYGELSDEMRYEAETNSGAYVYFVVNDSPAFHNNLIVGDVIIKIDEQKIVKPDDMTQVLANKAGKEVVLLIVRKGENKEISLKLNPAF
jgi:hypothetical protein